jgi:subtilisin family serine protease
MRVYPNLGVVYGAVDKTGYAALKADKKRVKAVVPAPAPRLIRPVRVAAAAAPTAPTWGIQFLDVPTLWNQGVTGEEVLVGHLDTGVDGSHPALANAIHAFAEFDDIGTLITHTPAQAFDSGQHGTHTAGTIAGRPVGTSIIGVAPGAKLVCGLVIEGGDVVARVLGGLDWVIGQNVRVLSMSLGIPGVNNEWLPIFQIIRSKNILPVIAVGNEFPGTSRSPGNYAESLSVGAIDEDGNVADFSSSQVFDREDDPLVPDLVAPGVDVISSLPGGGFGSMDGTSMATPHVAGLAALLIGEIPDKTPDEIEQAIYESCKRGPNMPESRANRGAPNAVRALQALKAQ